jgi:hypothetical protein
VLVLVSQTKKSSGSVPICKTKRQSNRARLRSSTTYLLELFPDIAQLGDIKVPNVDNLLSLCLRGWYRRHRCDLESRNKTSAWGKGWSSRPRFWKRAAVSTGLISISVSCSSIPVGYCLTVAALGVGGQGLRRAAERRVGNLNPQWRGQ